MNRRRCLLLFIVLAACTAPAKRWDEVLPQQAGEWQRHSVSELSQIPPLIAGMGVEAAASATYGGRGTIRVDVFRMKAETSAFELIQKWRQSDGLAVYKGPYFLVAQSGADPASARIVLQALQQSIR
jgi:hypothetical protein